MGILKKAIAFSAAMAISAMSVVAVNAEEDVVKGKINKPYANVTIQGEGAENFSYTLTNSKGEKVASWKGLCDDVEISAENVYKMTKDKPNYSIINDKNLYKFYDNSDMFEGITNLNFASYSNTTDDGETTQFYNNPITNLKVGCVNTLTLKKRKLPTQTEFTIPAGKYQYFADQGVLDKKYDVGISLTAQGEDFKYDLHYFNSAKSDLYDLPAKYSVERLFVEGNHSWSTNVYNSYVRKYDEDVGYAKVRVKLAGLLGFSDDGKIISESDSSKKYDLCETSGEHYRSLLVIMSGGAIQAVTPDKDGYIEFYVNTKDYYVGYHHKVHDLDENKTTVDTVGYTLSMPVETTTKVVDTTLDIPEKGVTFYNLEPDTYTVSIDNIEGALENNTFTVENTADLQEFTPVLNAELVPPEDSSSESKPDSSSEDEISSEEENSFDAEDSSELDSSSDVEESSELDNSSDVDSSSKVEDSSSKTSNNSSKNDSSPATGVAAGISISATLLAAVAVIISKKKK